MAHPHAPKPKSPLGYHRTLGPNAGVKVSPLCLGGMSLGDAWAEQYGAVIKTKAFEILDYFYGQYAPPCPPAASTNGLILEEATLSTRQAIINTSNRKCGSVNGWSNEAYVMKW